MLPKEFVLYTDHQALQYLNNQGKLNQRNFKWVEFMKIYIFGLKHRSERSNKVANALSRRQLLLTENQVEVVGFDELKNLYLEDPNFTKAWEASIEHITLDRTRWLDYLILDGM